METEAASAKRNAKSSSDDETSGMEQKMFERTGLKGIGSDGVEHHDVNAQDSYKDYYSKCLEQGYKEYYLHQIDKDRSGASGKLWLGDMQAGTNSLQRNFVKRPVGVRAGTKVVYRGTSGTVAEKVEEQDANVIFKPFEGEQITLPVKGWTRTHMWFDDDDWAGGRGHLERQNITVVLSIYPECKAAGFDNEKSVTEPQTLETGITKLLVTYHRFSVEDSPDAAQTLVAEFPRAFKVMDDALSAGKNVLVHCNAGVSRSTSVVLQYLIQKNKINFDEALALVRKCRMIACPNKGFEKELRTLASDALTY